jgi:hypothetical protein
MTDPRIRRSRPVHEGTHRSLRIAGLERPFLHLLACAALALVPCAAARGADVVSNWVGGSGDWSDAANWDSADFPDNNGLTYEAVIDTAEYSHVTLDEDVTIDNFAIGLGDTLSIDNGNDLTLAAGIPARTIMNAGTLSLESGGSPTSLYFDGEVTLDGGGTVSLVNFHRNRIVGEGPAPHLVNLNNIIQGTGHIGEYFTVGEPTAVTNAATIDANQPYDLVIKAAAGGTNTGILCASLGGTLVIDRGAWTNTGGIIEALDASTVRITSDAGVTGGTIRAADGAVVDLAYGPTIAGATLETTGTGVIRTTEESVLDSSAAGVTNAGSFEVADGASTTLKGAITNSGTLALAAAIKITHLDLEGTVTLDGGGTVTLSDSLENWMVGTGTTPHLVNQDNTIEGAGRLGQALQLGEETEVTNGGVIDANRPTSLILKAAPGGTNTGTLRASDGGTLHIDSGAWTNAGGVIEALDASSVEIVGGATVTGGTIGASGTGLVRVTSEATAALGPADPLDVDVAELASVLFEGTLDNTAGGTLTKTGDGTLVLAGTQQHGPGALLDVLGGIVEFNSDASGTGIIDDAHLSIQVTGGEVRFGCNQYLDTLTIGDGGLVRLTGANTVVVRHLVLDGINLGATTLVPEPAALALLAAGAVGLARKRRRA